MAPRIVYRIEHPEDGNGPWSRQIKWASSLDAALMPTPYGDGIESCAPGFFYACTSWAALVKWFSARDRRKLAEEGFMLCTYLVFGATRDGEEQLVFRMDAAELLDEEALIA